MKQKLAKLFILFVVMSVLTSSSKDSGIHGIPSPCTESKKDYPAAVASDQPVAAPEKNEETPVLSLADNEISLSPIGRFILVQ